MSPLLQTDPFAPLFRLKACGRFHATTNADLPEHWSAGVHWILTLNGSAYHSTASRTQYLTRGWAFANTDSTLQNTKVDAQSAEPWSGLYLSFDNTFAKERLDFVKERFSAINQISTNSECVRLARRLIADKKCDSWERAQTAFEWFHEWWKEAEEHHRKVVRLLDARVTAGEFSREPHSLKSLADQLGYSPGYLSSILRQRWNETPAKLMRRERLKHAAEQLASTNIRVEVLANQLGYRSVSSFIRVFRQTYGSPPEKYRKINNECG